ncbi:MAG: 1-deoxy-D-xylulose-5-phosphate reductoisomerase [Chitinophagaceae bacterium]|nr:1-deoxy-D-xylulose-5-phosphate reductoisomerase [Chitinophagaceae bacterium]
MKNISILGSTGSIGIQTLEVVRNNPHLFNVQVLTAYSNATLLIQQSREFKPKKVVIVNKHAFQTVFDVLKNLDIEVLCGETSLAEVAQYQEVDLVVIGLVGFSGLAPTINAIKAKKNIALANKETLVVAGELITQLASINNINIYPIDSEHSALFQCLMGESHNAIEKVILTASGGPFRGKKREYLANVTREMALKHPNWVMGAKITIDSASLMNKGLEVIEAKWLFQLSAKQIEVIIHHQSIIHSLVQFTDGSIKAQMGIPDMKLPILFALTYPNRVQTNFPRFHFQNYPSLTFESPDYETFKNLSFAFQSLEKGGNYPCILNAANEIAVEEFLKGTIRFLDIFDVVEESLHRGKYISHPIYEEYVLTDAETRTQARDYIKKK